MAIVRVAAAVGDPVVGATIAAGVADRPGAVVTGRVVMADRAVDVTIAVPEVAARVVMGDRVVPATIVIAAAVRPMVGVVMVAVPVVAVRPMVGVVMVVAPVVAVRPMVGVVMVVAPVVAAHPTVVVATAVAGERSGAGRSEAGPADQRRIGAVGASRNGR